MVCSTFDRLTITFFLITVFKCCQCHHCYLYGFFLFYGDNNLFPTLFFSFSRRCIFFPKYSNNRHSSPQNYSSTDYSTIFCIFCHTSILRLSEQIYFYRNFTGKPLKCLHSSSVFVDHFPFRSLNFYQFFFLQNQVCHR